MRDRGNIRHGTRVARGALSMLRARHWAAYPALLMIAVLLAWTALLPLTRAAASMQPQTVELCRAAAKPDAPGPADSETPDRHADHALCLFCPGLAGAPILSQPAQFEPLGALILTLLGLWRADVDRADRPGGIRPPPRAPPQISAQA